MGTAVGATASSTAGTSQLKARLWRWRVGAVFDDTHGNLINLYQD